MLYDDRMTQENPDWVQLTPPGRLNTDDLRAARGSRNRKAKRETFRVPKKVAKERKRGVIAGIGSAGS
jgi:hypothetical protein